MMKDSLLKTNKFSYVERILGRTGRDVGWRIGEVEDIGEYWARGMASPSFD